jgi:hypothetical protein
MKNTHITESIVIGLFLFAVMVGVVIFINQGDFIVDQAIQAGKSSEEAKSILMNSIIAKGISVVLLVALFYFGSTISKKSIEKTKVRFLPFLFVIYAILYGGLCALIHEFLNPFFEFSLLKGPLNDSQSVKAIPPFFYYSIIGLGALFSSITFSFMTIKNAKPIGVSIQSFGLRFWSVNYFLNFIIILMIYFVAIQSRVFSLSFIFIVINLLIAALVSTFIGSLILSTIVKSGKWVFNNLSERVSLGFFSIFGVFSFVMVLGVIAFALDSSFFTSFDLVPAGLIRLLSFAIISGTIAILVWKYNVAGARTEVQMANINSELTLLKSQINPHFLFNSLNTVYALALNEESPKTAHAVQQLSEMMRFMLHENTAEKIELRKEVEYLENFIELQKLRLDQNQNIQLDIEIDDACEGEIAPMLLIPFVENAFKHGISLKEPSWIKIRLSCADKKVHLNVNNSVHKRLEDPEMGKSGIGQENVRKRLAILYPEKHLFQLYEAEDNYGANIKIDLS